MKKYLFFAVAALAMTSCSQDEVMEVAQKEAISFKDAFVENATRAIDNTITTTSLDKFYVYGNTQGNEEGATIVPIFNNLEVTKTETTNEDGQYKCTYDENKTQYWIEGNLYNFAAVKNGTVTELENGLPKTITYTAAANYADQTDLLYARPDQYVGKAKGSNVPVAFTFDHLLSKAMFTVKNTMPKNTQNATYFYRVSNVVINDVYSAGTYTIASNGNTWATTGEATLDVPFGNVNKSTEETSAKALEIGMQDQATAQYQRLFIPTTYSALKFTCTIETLIKTGDNYSVINTEYYDKTIAHTFAAGNAYNFIISLGVPGDPIEFTVTKVNDWIPATGGTEVTLPEVNQ